MFKFYLLLITTLIGCEQNSPEKIVAATTPKEIIQLQAPKGEYKVGVVSMNFTDSSRNEVASPDSMKLRTLYTQIWYPTNDDGKTNHYLGDQKKVKGFAEIEDEIWMDRFNRVRTNNIKEAKIATTEKKYPVVFFSAGFGLSKNYNTMFLEGLASYGFIVVSVDIPYVNPLVTDTGEAINSTDSFWDSFPMTKGIDNFEEGKKKFDFTYDYLSEDYKFILGQLRMLKNHDYLGYSLDLERLASIGHSAGSIPTFGLMRNEESPFKAFIVYDVNLHANYVSEVMFFSKTNKTYSPICLFMLEYSSIPPQEFIGSLNAELTLFSIKGANHSSISDIDFINYSEKEDSNGVEMSLLNLNKIISRTVNFLRENLY